MFQWFRRSIAANNAISEAVLSRSGPRAVRDTADLEGPAAVAEAQELLDRLADDPRLCGQVDIEGAPEEMRALIEHTRKVWSAYGENDPFYSVITKDCYRMEAMTDEQEKEFYASGSLDVDSFLLACKRNRIDPPLNGTFLDFGCGVGRASEHFASVFKTYVGVDISAPHLARAKARAAALGQGASRFVTLSDYLAQPMSCDAFYSFLVLQHNPPPIMAMLLARLCATLRPGGIGLFQVPGAIFDYEFRLAEYLKFMPSYDAMEMHALPQYRVFEILERNGCRPLEILFANHIGSIGISTKYLILKAR